MPGARASVHGALIVALAARYKLPAIYPFRYHATGGGLISYGPDFVEPFRPAAGYVDRILKGEKPADLPVPGGDEVRTGNQPQRPPRRSASTCQTR